MRKRISKPIESLEILPDKVIQFSDDGLTASVVDAIPTEFPPVRTFEVDNLLRNGVSFQPIGTFIHSSLETNMDTIDLIEKQIEDNELV